MNILLLLIAYVCCCFAATSQSMFMFVFVKNRYIDMCLAFPVANLNNPVLLFAFEDKCSLSKSQFSVLDSAHASLGSLRVTVSHCDELHLSWSDANSSGSFISTPSLGSIRPFCAASNNTTLFLLMRPTTVLLGCVIAWEGLSHVTLLQGAYFNAAWGAAHTMTVISSEGGAIPNFVRSSSGSTPSFALLECAFDCNI